MDVVTEPPPPSRFFQDDLDNFAAPSPPLPSPFLLQNPKIPTNPNLLLVAISSPSLSLLGSVPGKTLVGTLFLPEIPLSRVASPSSPIEIYSSSSGRALLVAVGCHVSPERSRAVAKLLLKELGRARVRVLVLDSIRGEHYRGRLSADEPSAFKLETTEERRKGSGLARGMKYLGPGSLVDGLAAAVLAECEMRRLEGTTVVTWPPQGGREVVGILKKLLGDLGVETGLAGAAADHGFLQAKSDLYL